MKLADTVKTIVFDWGDTLMVDDPRQNTPMVDWPKVSAVPGSSETLAKLHGRYHLALATSAELSTVEQIRAALARGGLNEFIDDVFTKNQLNGARKPEIGFYRGIALKLTLQPDQLLMVGDHYRADILGASAAGWFTAWYNPMQKTSTQLNPLYDLDLTSLTELPAALQQSLLPNLTQCLDWTLIEGTSAALRSHVELVACVAYTLAAWLRSAGQGVDPLLAHRGGILHDLCKMSAKGQGLNHGQAARAVLLDKGQPRLAEIARTHMLFNLIDPASSPHTWEEKLVYYADKLIEKNQILSVEQRLAGFRERYSMVPEMIDQVSAAILPLEQEICAPLNMDADELLRQMQESFFAD